jgi:hypothetical protein
MRLAIGEPTWKSLERESVEALVGAGGVDLTLSLAIEVSYALSDILGVWGESNVA